VSKAPTAAAAAPAQSAPPVQQRKPAKMVKVYIIFYTTYGHIYTMAKAVKEGVDSVEGCEGVLYQVSWRPSEAPGHMRGLLEDNDTPFPPHHPPHPQVPETLPAEVLDKMHAPPKPDVPVITAAELPDAGGWPCPARAPPARRRSPGASTPPAAAFFPCARRRLHLRLRHALRHHPRAGGCTTTWAAMGALQRPRPPQLCPQPPPARISPLADQPLPCRHCNPPATPPAIPAPP
jgi:hypothetical protein